MALLPPSCASVCGESISSSRNRSVPCQQTLDPILKIAVAEFPHAPRNHLAVAEEQQRRYAGHLIAPRQLWTVVDIDREQGNRITIGDVGRLRCYALRRPPPRCVEEDKAIGIVRERGPRE